jgi:energy-coupling factor transporter ATP-binding protein EcfA2
MSAERAQELERLYKARRSHDPHIPINNDNHHFLEAQNISRPTTTRSWSSKHFSRLGGSYYASAGTQKQPPMSSLVPPRQSSLEPPSATAEESRPKICDDCEFEQNPLWNCSYCGMNFCDQCWDKQAQHRKGRTGPDGLPHEKANPAIVRRLKDILTPPVGHTEQQSLHVEDEDTTWFGLGRNSQNAPVFQDYGRYSTIMADSDTGDFKDRYPQLVSFIGQTGAGKSTLIKMLIDQQERKHSLQGWALPSPVAGTSTNGSVPTSGDVHLYSDPATYATEYPMLYADCEGLEGGENIPMAVQYRNSASGVQKEKSRDEHAPKEHRKRRMVSKGFHVVQKDIKWANSDTFKRQYAVTELYPRLLYTFSDVVVFVLRNAKYVLTSSLRMKRYDFPHPCPRIARIHADTLIELLNRPSWNCSSDGPDHR